MQTGDRTAQGAEIFSVTIETPDGRLPPAKVVVPHSPIGLADLVPPMHGLCDGVVSLAVKKAAHKGNPTRCKAGCGVCCRQMVPVSIPEAFFLWHETLLAEDGYSQLVNERFARTQAALERSGLWNTLENCTMGREQAAAAADYWNLSIPCPYLADESCAIHPVRPCSCREYNVYTDPEFCKQLLAYKVKRIGIHRKMTAALSRTAADVLSAAPVLIPLAMIPQWCAAHAELDQLRWDGPQLFELMLYFALKG